MKLYKEYFLEVAERQQEETAVMTIQNGIVKEITWNKLRDDICALGTTLSKKSNRKICILGENSYEWILVHMSVMFGMGMVIPMEKELSVEELVSQTKKVDADIIFCSEMYMDKGMEIKKAIPSIELIDMQSDVFENMLATVDPQFVSAISNADECVSITFTSGTTAGRKGVMLSRKNITTCARGVSEAGFFRGDKVPVILPLYHCYSCFVGVYGVLLSGCTICFCQDMKRLSQHIRLYQANKMVLVPAIAQMFLDEMKKNNITVDAYFGGYLEWIIVGGAKTAVSMIEAYGKMGIPIREGYGITETSSFVTVLPADQIKPGSVGVSSRFWEIKIADSGEVLVKGDNVMSGYLEGEANCISETGWFHTGDMGYIDEDGFLYIKGRIKNVIILKNGKNIFPEELEENIQKIEMVKEVLVYDKEEKIVAEIYTETEGIEDKISELNKEMPSYKRIQKVIVRNTPFDKTGGQKIKRKL